MTKPALVLIADNQPHVLVTLEYLVKQVTGTQVITADNGEDAARLALGRRPNLVLMEIALPGIDGYTACQTIRDGWGEHPGAVWFITARGLEYDPQRAAQVGCRRMIHKPFDPDELVEQIGQALHRRAA